MKKVLWAVASGILLSSATWAASLTVQSPNGGESWILGSPRTITWTASGVASPLTILLVQGDEKIGVIAENVPVVPGSRSWSAGQYVGGTAAPGSSYKILITDAGGTATDSSNGFFTLAAATSLPPPPPPVFLKLTEPNGGESWRLGSPQILSWTSTNLSGQVTLELVREPNQPAGTIASDLPASGSRPWNAGDIQGGRVEPGQYRVRVRSQATPARFDDSDAPFTLAFELHGAVPHHPVDPWTRVPAVYQNWGGKDAFPKQYQIPLDVIQARPICDPGQPNVRARVGRDWFFFGNESLQYAALHRSRVHFVLAPYQGQAAQLTEARMRLKQISSVRNGTNDASCGSNACDLLAPWTSFEPSGLGACHLLNSWQTEYTVDVTETVRGWLNGSLPNHGILLFARELPMQNPWTCVSCFEVTLELKF